MSIGREVHALDSAPDGLLGQIEELRGAWKDRQGQPKPAYLSERNTAAPDDPYHDKKRSDVYRETMAKIEAAQARSMVSLRDDSEDEVDLREFCSDAGLTDRQRDVVCLVAEGWSQRQVGEWLGIALTTVRQHLRVGRYKLAGQRPSRKSSGRTSGGGYLPLELAKRLSDGA